MQEARRESISAAGMGSSIASRGGEGSASSGWRVRRPSSWVADLGFLRRGKARTWLLALLTVAIGRGLVYTLVVPPWQHPDEPSHFEHVRYIAEQGKLPAPDAVDVPLRRAIAASMRRFDYWPYGPPPLEDASLSTPYVSAVGYSTFVQPRLYYVAAAIWLKPWLGASIEAQVTIVRLLSVLLNLLLITSGFLTVRTLFPENLNLAAAAGAFLVFLPGLSDIMAAVNNDVLINAIAGVLFLVLARIFRRGPTWASIGLTAGLLTAAVFTKRTGAVLALMLPAAALAYALRSRRRWLLVAALSALLLVVVVGAAVWALRAPSSVQADMEAWFYRYFRAGLVATLQNLVSPDRMKVYMTTAVVVYRSFWAAFGWRNVLLAPGWYGPTIAATALAAAGLLFAGVRAGARPNTKARWWRRSYLVFCGAAVSLAWWAAIVRSQAFQGPNLYLSHGRYAYVAVVPFALLFVLGLQAWIPPLWRPRAVWVFLAMMVVFDAVAFWGYLVPFYHSFA